MRTLLLDTNIVSYIFKRDSRAQAYTPLLHGNRLAISFMTAAELYQWAVDRNWGRARTARMEQQMTTYLLIPPDRETCRTWGSLRAERQLAGRTIDTPDAWIAATALQFSLPLVTHNPKHFDTIAGLDVRTVAIP